VDRDALRWLVSDHGALPSLHRRAAARLAPIDSPRVGVFVACIHLRVYPAEMLAGLQKDDDIVVCRSNPECLASLAVYHRLADHGYANVRRYAGGLDDWESGGLPLEGEWVRR
jgi:rhodanese-related sulfurtransferase